MKARDAGAWRPARRRPTGGAAQDAASPLPAPSFLPLTVDEERGAEPAAPGGGSPHSDWLAAQTVAFNVQSREHPEDLQNWLDFAAFQDTIAAQLGRRAASERSTAEKKIAILERALQHHPDSDELLLALLAAARPLCDERELDARWQRALGRRPGSASLWRAYLELCRGRSFAGFRVTALAETYARAIQTLGLELQKLRDVGREAEIIARLERETVGLVLQSLLLLRQAGFTEWFVAAAQTLLEFQLFAPTDWGDEARAAMFEDFWASGAPFIGEDGAGGWRRWLDGAQESAAVARPAPSREAAPAAAPDPGPDHAAGQWSGWESLGAAVQAKFGHSLHFADEEGGDVEDERNKIDDDDVGDAEAAEEEPEDEEALMARLGLELDQALESREQVSDDVLRDWLALERARTATQWRPVRATDARIAEELARLESAAAEADADEALNVDRSVAWSRVSHLVQVSVTSPIAREELVLGVLALLDAPLPPLALASGSPASLDLAALRDAPLELAHAGNGANAPPRDRWFLRDPGRADFLVRTLVLLVDCSAADPSAGGGPSEASNLFSERSRRCIRLALLEGLRLAQGTAAAKQLSKQLLAQHRSDTYLWEALVRLESRAGNAKAARKIAYACLSSRGTAPLTLDDPYAPLVLLTARLECGAVEREADDDCPQAFLPLQGVSETQRKAGLRLLAWCGTAGGVELPAAGGAAPSDLTLPEETAARRGFQMLLGRATALGADALSEQTAAAALAAAAFEQMARRTPVAALTVLDGVLGALGIGAEPGASDSPNEARRASALLDRLRRAKRCPAMGQSSAACELLAVARAELAVRAAGELIPPAVAPTEAAHHLLINALPAFPASAAALRLLPQAATLGPGLTLARAALRALRDATPLPALCAALPQLEAAVGSPAGVVRRALETALAQGPLHRVPGGWRALLALESGERGDHARRTALRAVATCPWAKDLWLQSLTAMLGGAPAQELVDLVHAMRDKQVSVRAELMEAVLQRLQREAW